MAFSTVDRDSFDAVKNWLRKVNASHYNLIQINHHAYKDVSDTFHLSAHTICQMTSSYHLTIKKSYDRSYVHGLYVQLLVGFRPVIANSRYS